MKRKFISLLAASIILCSLLTLATAIPTEIIDQEQETCGGLYYATAYPGKLVQSFKPALNTLTKVSLYGWKNTTPPNNVSISIRNSLDGEDLTSVVVLSNQIKTLIPDWFTADFPDISVTPETTYYIIWEPTEDDENEPYFWWCYNKANPGGDPYNRGSQIINGEEVERADFCFRTYGYSIPTVSITSPENGEEIGGVISITGTAEDNDGAIQRIEIKIDDQEWMTADGLENWDYEWNSRNSDNGLHTISARSFDGESYSEISTITVFTKNSALIIIDLTGGYGGVTATIEVTGDEPVKNIQWSIQVTGGFLGLIDVAKNGEFQQLDENAEEEISAIESFFGLGPVEIIISAESDNSYPKMLEATGFVIGPIIVLI